MSFYEAKYVQYLIKALSNQKGDETFFLGLGFFSYLINALGELGRAECT